MTEQSEIVAGRLKHAVRASRAKSTGLVTGKLTIAPDLPPEQPVSAGLGYRSASRPSQP